MVFLRKILVHFTTILLNNRYNLLLYHIYKNTNQIQSNLINKCPSCCSRHQEFKPGRQITTQICCWSIIMYIKHFIEKIVALHLFKHQRPYLKGYLLLITRSLFSQKRQHTCMNAFWFYINEFNDDGPTFLSKFSKYMKQG